MDIDDYKQSLRNKIIEESQEVANASKEELITEIADLYEVIDALVTAYEIDKLEITKFQQKRRDERGGFEKRIRLLWTD